MTFDEESEQGSPFLQNRIGTLNATPGQLGYASDYPTDPDFRVRSNFMNPMCGAAMPLIGLAMRLETLDKHDDLAELYRLVHIEISNIQAQMHELPYDSIQVSAYTYALCMFLDETVMSRPWGRYSIWSHTSLLGNFHDDTLGGEKFFTLLARMEQEPKRFKDVLEFMYLVLCLGLKGKYALESNGEQILKAHIDRLHKVIFKLRPPLPELFPDALSNVAPRNFRMRRFWPWWSPILFATGVIAAMYGYHSYRLHQLTAEVLESLNLILQQ